MRSYNKYLHPKNYINYAKRKISWIIKVCLLFWGDAKISKSADLSLFCHISSRDGRVEIGEQCIIDHGAVLRTYGGKITLGNYCTIGPNCVLYSGGNLTIGNGVRIGPLTAIIAGNHIFSDRSKYIYTQGTSNIGISISDDVWIGAGVKILDGITIGLGAVIAAGAVVTKSVNDYEVVAGIPAKVIKIR